MKLSDLRFVVLRFSIVLAVVLAVLLPARAQSSTTPGVFFTGNQVWQQGPNYPGGPFSAGSCAVWNSTITCVGGTDNDATYTAPLTANGIGAWQQGANYGEGGQNSFLSCATGQTNYIYCVGGDNLGGDTGNVTSDTWWSQLNAGSGALNWSDTNELLGILLLADGGKITNGLWNSSCFIHSSYLYCVGGFIQTQSIIISGYGSVDVPIETPTSDVFANQLGASGAGGWGTTTSYGEGIAGQSCVTYNGYAYCVGGVTGNSLNSYDVSDVWYAPFNSNGSLGPWTQTTSYGGGAVDGLSCSVVFGQMVCVGGNVGGSGNSPEIWSAPLTPNGVGTWTQQIPAYPESVWEPSCVSNLNTISCVGGGNTAGGWANLGQSVGGDVNTYSLTLSMQINLGDATSCSAIGGLWDSSTSVCGIGSNETLNAGVSLNILPGTILVIGAPGPCTSDCDSSLTFTNQGGILIQSGGQILNYATLNNQGGFGDAGDFTNNGSLVNSGGFGTEGTQANPNQLGTFENNGSVTNSGVLSATASPLGTGTVVVNGSTCFAGNSTEAATILATDPFMVDGTWSNGGCELDAPAALPIGVVEPVNIPAGVTWQIPSGTTLLNQNEIDVNGVIDNAGTFINNQINNVNTTPWGPGVLDIANVFNNAGTLIAENGGYIDVAGALANTSAIHVESSGVLEVIAGGSLTSSGTITLDAGTTLTDLGAITNSGTIDNSGAIDANGSVLDTLTNTGGGSIVNRNGGTTDGSGGTITTNIGATTVELTPAYCAQIGGQWLPGRNACVNTGNINTLDASTILQIPAGVTLLNYSQIYAPGEIDNYGTIVNVGYLVIGNPTTNATGAFYNQGGASIQNFGVLANWGGSTSVNNGTILNGPPDSSVFIDASGTGSLDNFGTFTNNGEIDNYAVIDNNSYNGSTPSLVNKGSIGDLCSGSFTGSATYSGTMPLSSGCATPAPPEPTVVILTNRDAQYANEVMLYGMALDLYAQVYPESATGTATYLINGATPIPSSDAYLNASSVQTLQYGGAQLNILSLPEGTPAISVSYSGDGTHTASSSEPYYQVSLPNSSADYQSVALGDFEGDGKPDAAMVQIANSSVQIYHNNGDGTFTNSNGYDVGQASTFTPSIYVATADLNGDGKLDLAVATSTGVSVLLGNGDGTFQTPVNIPAGDLPSMLVIADVNGDGKPDIVLGNLGSNYVTVLLGNGDGTFQAPINSTASNWPQAIAVGDFNHDGKLDLAVGSQVDKTVSVLLGNGDGTFQAPVAVLNGFTQPTSIAVQDFNGDGNPDIAVADASANTVSIFTGNGDGTFTPGSVIPVSAAPASLITADFNGDGVPDLALVSQSASVVNVLIGNGDGAFQTPISAAAGPDPAAVASAALTGNGVQDLVTANLNLANYSVVLGPFGGPGPTSLSVTGGTFTYDGVAHPAACVATDSSGATVPGSCALTYNGSQTAPVNAGTYAVSATFTPANAAQYQSATGSTTIAIQPVALTVTANNATNVYGQPLPQFTASYAGFVSGDTAVALQGTLQFSTSAAQGSLVGQYTVTPGGLSSTNYIIAYASGTLTITPATLVAAAASITRSYWAADPPLTGTLTGVVNGDGITVTFTDTIAAGAPAGVYANAIVPQLADPNHRLGNYTVTLVDGTLTITNPLPALTSLSVDSMVARNSNHAGGNLSITLVGSNFVPQSVVQWNGTAIATAFVDQNHLTAILPAADLTQTGVDYITVSNAAAGAGGGVSNAEAFFLTYSSAPVTNSATATGAANGTLTIGGSGAGTPNSLAASWTGTGTVTIAQYASNPSGRDLMFTTGRRPQFDDVYVAPGNTITSLTIVDCTRGSNVAYWFNGKQWEPASQQSYNPSTGCVTVTVTNSTSPTIAQLSGTYFVTGVDSIPPFVTTIGNKCASGNSDCAKDRRGFFSDYFFGTWTNQPVEVDLRAEDNPGGSGVASIAYSATGAGVIAATTVPGAKADFEISAEGTTTITYSATDYANNISKPQKTVVKIDDAAPVVTVAANPSVVTPSFGGFASVKISGQITDALSGVATASYRMVGSGGPMLSGGPIRLSPDGSYSLTILLPAQGNGPGKTERQFTVEIVATDRAGNTGSASAIVVMSKAK